MGTGRPLGNARRILIYGVTRSGKTTLAKRLAEATEIEWHAVDDLTWEPGWVEVPGDEQRRRVQRICEQPEWILDTAYGMWLDVPLGRAQLIVALDYPRWFSLQRLLRRTVRRLIDRREICNGNRESLRGFLAGRNNRLALQVFQRVCCVGRDCGPGHWQGDHLEGLCVVRSWWLSVPA